jgi:T5SS/PEP-CTERM-associated repeat protein/autotransporter-associated beta strand protein
LATALIVVGHLFAGATALAQVSQTSWINSGTGLWVTPANWSSGLPSGVPLAVINNGGTAQLILTTATANNLTLGQNAGQSGNLQLLNLAAMPTQLNIADTLLVGAAGRGTLSMADGAKLTSKLGVIGQSGLASSALLSGSNTRWTLTQSLHLGNGTLSVFEGAVVNSATADIWDPVGPSTATVGGSDATWNTTGDFEVGSLGPGKLAVLSGGIVSVGGVFTIYQQGEVSIGNGGGGGMFSASSIVDAGTLRFNNTDSVNMFSPLTSRGDVIKEGSGTATLDGVSDFTGTFAANAGRLVLNGTLNPGSTYTANSGGILRLDSAKLIGGDAELRANSGGTVEYVDATVKGAFLRGPGTHILFQGTSTFTGVTAFNSTVIMQNAASNFANFSNGAKFTNNAPLTFDGAVNTASGLITVNNALAANDFSSLGVITVNNGGTLTNSVSNLILGGGSRTTVNSGGSIQLLPGTSLELLGALLVNNGQVNGPVNVNFGSLAKGTGSYTTVSVFDGGKFAPGTSPGLVTISSTYTQVDGSTLLAEIGGTSKGAQYDALAITGAANLDGTLDVSLINSFVPASGNSFELLHANGGIVGAFKQVSLPTLGAGLAWNVVYSNFAVILQVNASIIAGDYNGDGIVDAADYTVWRDTLGSTTDLRANGDNTGASAGKIDQADYTFWKTNFGAHAGSGSGGSSNAAVAEPTTLLLLIVGAVGVSIRGRWCAKRVSILINT